MAVRYCESRQLHPVRKESSMQLSAPKTLTTERGQFAYRDAGATDGTPAGMLHGWPENSYCWAPLVDRLAPGLRVIAPHLRGLGDSPREPEPAQFQKQALAAGVGAMLD